MKSTQGWSLLELVIVLSIVTILSLIGTPSFSNHIKQSQSEKAAKIILHSLKLAQQQSVAKKKVITLCPTVNQQCSRTHAQHLTAFFDGNENRQIDENEEVFSFSKVANDSSYIRIKASFGVPYIRFKPSSFAMESASIFYCPEREDIYGQVITVNLAGRAYMLEDEKLMKGRIDC